MGISPLRKRFKVGAKLDSRGVEAAKPFLRWAGSKRFLLSKLEAYWGDHKRYVEPFCGSGALFFRLRPNASVLGDINPLLMIAFRAIRSNPASVSDFLDSYRNTEKQYYAIRSAGIRARTHAETAARFIFLNRNCFNGLYRTNKTGQFNVPYSGKRSGVLPTREQLRLCGEALKQTELIAGDFETIVKTNLKRGDFVYLDPPFAVRNTRVFRQYDPQSFGLEDVQRLARLLDHIDRKGANFVLSYADAPEMDAIKKRWEWQSVLTHRNIAGFRGARGGAKEVMVSNLEASDG